MSTLPKFVWRFPENNPLKNLRIVVSFFSIFSKSFTAEDLLESFRKIIEFSPSNFSKKITVIYFFWKKTHSEFNFSTRTKLFWQPCWTILAIYQNFSGQTLTLREKNVPDIFLTCYCSSGHVFCRFENNSKKLQ